ncbi:hypothetical protein BG015_009564 [Linnemannia schmuckeri]|uniref:Uncharacterized protein n=1 Tax=Linnemannia schmuckeri TaxID=64567 RepID=A0A9P5V9Q0_9FUNG|nr:hypothetical protein BG015_009564 [Linnemannia schmuckeri]
MVLDSSIPTHHIYADTNTSSPASASTLTREHLQQHNQRQQLHHHRPAPVRPICTTLPRYNNNQQQQGHHDDSPTTATVNNNSDALATTVGIDLSEPETARTLFSLSGDGDPTFQYNKHTLREEYPGYPSHNPFDDPSSIDNGEDEAHRPIDPSSLTRQQRSEPDQQQQQKETWSNGRHPLTNRKWRSLYVRFFRLDNTPATHSSQIVHSTWLWTGALFLIRCMMFLYAASVLLADIILTERPRYEFCYLTQLSYLGLTSYLGTVSWHTLSEWRRERGLRATKTSSSYSSTGDDKEAGAVAVEDMMAARTTTIERQHWFLTDMNFFLYHTICTFHVIVPLLFWGYLSVQGEARTMAVEMSVNSLWRNYSFHGGDLILVLLEISINSMPFIPSHIVIVFFICLLYLAEAHLVHYVDGFWIYPFLDTSVGPIWAAMYLGVGFVIAVAFGAMYFLHRGRNWWFARRAAAKALAASGEAVVPEMVAVASSILTVYPGTHLHSTFSSATPLPSGTVLISTSTGTSGNYAHSSSNPSNNPVMTHTNTSTALFPTAAPPSTIVTTPAGFDPTHQSLAIPTQILIQNRRRSYSNCSNDSTTSTLVGSDENMSKDKEKNFEAAGDADRPISERTAMRLSMNGATQPQVDGNALQKVDEEDGYETEGDR